MCSCFSGSGKSITGAAAGVGAIVFFSVVISSFTSDLSY
jgi:hypothetical protein